METDKIYNMDCLEGMKQIPDNSIDLVVTDPPYNTGMQANNAKAWLSQSLVLSFINSLFLIAFVITAFIFTYMEFGAWGIEI